ncbi:MAG: hypothetical protein MJY87_00215 [Fibrobacter sp.]|nr:hypothetical protein [Fibrobacter sp.]
MKKILFAMLALAVSLFAAEKVYLAPISLVGMHGDYGIVSSKLMKAYIEDDGRYVLVVGSAQDSVNVDNQSGVRDKAVSLGCSKYILAEFTRLGENVLMSFKLYNTDSEAPVWDDRLKAANPDDFDPIIQRVARNIGTKRKATTDDDIYSVTQKETEEPTRKGVSSYLGVSLGGLFAMQPDVDALAGVSVFLHYDFGYLLAGIDAGFYGIDNQLEMGNINLSVYYPFGTRALTPYVGGGIGIGYTTFDSEIEYGYDCYEDDRGGLSGFLGGGLLINRNSKLLLNLNVRYVLNFYKTKNWEVRKNDMGGVNIVQKSHAINGLMINFGIARGF